MHDFAFTPTSTDIVGIEVPFLEDARADFAPYYDSARDPKRIMEAKDAVVIELAKLGAGGVHFTEGFFGVKPKRYGYLIDFAHMGGVGRMQVAGLPIKLEVTEKKILRVRVQALLNVRDWLKAAVTSQVFAPGSYPLLQYLLVGDGQHTLAETAMAARGLPEVNPLLPSVNQEQQHD